MAALTLALHPRWIRTPRPDCRPVSLLELDLGQGRCALQEVALQLRRFSELALNDHQKPQTVAEANPPRSWAGSEVTQQRRTRADG